MLTVAVSSFPSWYRVVEKRFFWPSYAPRGVKMAGAVWFCMACMISMHRLFGSLLDDENAI